MTVTVNPIADIDAILNNDFNELTEIGTTLSSEIADLQTQLAAKQSALEENQTSLEIIAELRQFIASLESGTIAGSIVIPASSMPETNEPPVI